MAYNGARSDKQISKGKFWYAREKNIKNSFNLLIVKQAQKTIRYGLEIVRENAGDERMGKEDIILKSENKEVAVSYDRTWTKDTSRQIYDQGKYKSLERTAYWFDESPIEILKSGERLVYEINFEDGRREEIELTEFQIATLLRFVDEYDLIR